MKCFYCKTELPRPGEDFVLYVEDRIIKGQSNPICAGCLKRQKKKPLWMRKVMKTGIRK